MRSDVFADLRGGINHANRKRGCYNRPALCLPLDLLPGWLFTLSPSRVKPEYRERVQRYRGLCYRALWRAFQRGELFPNKLKRFLPL